MAPPQQKEILIESFYGDNIGAIRPKVPKKTATGVLVKAVGCEEKEEHTHYAGPTEQAGSV